MSGSSDNPQTSFNKIVFKGGTAYCAGYDEKYMDDWSALIGKEYQKSTLSRYGNCYDSLQTVINEFYKKRISLSMN